MIRFSSALDGQQAINVFDNCIYLGKPFGVRFDRLITGGFKPKTDGEVKDSPMMGKFQQENGVAPTGDNRYIQAMREKHPGPKFDPPVKPSQMGAPPQVSQYTSHGLNLGQKFQNSGMGDYGFGSNQPSDQGFGNFPSRQTPNLYGNQVQENTRSRSPIRSKWQNIDSDDEDVQKLASRLGISKRMLNAIRVLAKDEDEESINLKNLQNQPPRSISTPTKSKNYSETNFTPEISQTPATDNYGHTPTTMDTIYCR